MIRRSFRIGLWLGLLFGVGFALAKLFRPKPEPSFSPAAREWPPLEPSVPKPAAAPVVSTPAAPAAAPAPAPARPAPAPAAPAPVAEAAPAPAAAPVEKKPAVKKAAAPKKAPAAKKAPAKKVLATWVDPQGNICPKSHPVKAKLSSKIFQVPGNFAYERTKPDRCYASVDAATSDGLRPAKR